MSSPESVKENKKIVITIDGVQHFFDSPEEAIRELQQIRQEEK